ncbi:Predicted Peptidoglycan domain-containing protein [Tenacibaculum sp. MAR_2009_124]|uniref:glycoside hydrolase family 108 protein n=1 Tax=Tenacibaculum sp. MAR_2009_124 TaxID=1250059 RepID=UPI00089BFAC3|nr:glycosyl hydrolase 108 family protein [Tenacibaculum sp. MAR_2009_124]SED22148.1 Predicted Peptidoglycan domain-containing protein [Tenacibaculum sp. MAR_2009_124]
MASYELFKTSIEAAEGGFQLLKNDKGNYNSRKELVGTNHGVSAKFYERVIGRPPSVEDMKSLTKAESHILFKNEFWDKVRADEIQSQGVAEIIADHAINANPRVTAKIVQRTLNNYFGKSLAVDGAIGSQTLQAINSVDDKLLFEKIADGRLAYYKSLSDYRYFAKSWTSRVYELARKFGIEIKKKEM